MGANASKSVQTVTNEIKNELNQRGASSTICEAGIQVGDITLRNADNCTVRNENRCTAKAETAIGAVTEAATTAFQGADKRLKTKLLPGFNVSNTRQEIKNQIENTINQECMASAQTRMDIATGNIFLDGCKNSTIENINAGSAEANCAINSIIRSTIDASQELKEELETGGLDDIFGGLGVLGALGPLAPLSSLFLSCSPCVSSILLFCCLILLMLLPNLMPQRQ